MQRWVTPPFWIIEGLPSDECEGRFRQVSVHQRRTNGGSETSQSRIPNREGARRHVATEGFCVARVAGSGSCCPQYAQFAQVGSTGLSHFGHVGCSKVPQRGQNGNPAFSICLQPGHGFGIAGGFDKGGYIATCAEVAVDSASHQVRVVRVVSAFDCGAVVNPDGLRNQVEGANNMGIGGALFEAIQFENGRILNPHFAQYRVPRFSDAPAMEVVLIDRKDVPSAGAGETPIVGIAPAIGNAIFAATGKRLRALPMAPAGV